jgi:hypothetical protein
MPNISYFLVSSLECTSTNSIFNIYYVLLPSSLFFTHDKLSVVGTVGSIMRKWTNFAASITRVLEDGLKKFKYPVHSGEFAGCTRLGAVNAKDILGGTYVCHSVFQSVLQK